MANRTKILRGLQQLQPKKKNPTQSERRYKNRKNSTLTRDPVTRIFFKGVEPRCPKRGVEKSKLVREDSTTPHYWVREWSCLNERQTDVNAGSKGRGKMDVSADIRNKRGFLGKEGLRAHWLKTLESMEPIVSTKSASRIEDGERREKLREVCLKVTRKRPRGGDQILTSNCMKKTRENRV